MKKNRPRPITIIGWYLIIAYALTLGGILTILLRPNLQDIFNATGTPIALSLGSTFLSSAVLIFSGILILKGLKPGKYIALVYMPVGMLIGSLLNGVQSSLGSLIIGIIIYIIIFRFLSGKDAQMYFSHEWTEPADTVFEEKEPVSAPVDNNVLVYESVATGSVGEKFLANNTQDVSAQKPGIARKIISTAFFFFGDTILIVYFAFTLPVIMNLPRGQGALAGVMAFIAMVFIAGILILIGFLIWGFKHGRGLLMLGTFFTGAWTVLGALGLIMFQFSQQYPELQEVQQNLKMDLTSTGLYMMIAGIINLIIAALLSPEFKKLVSSHIIRKKEEKDIL